MKKSIAVLLTAIFACAAYAGWVADPLDVRLNTSPVITSLSVTGAVTLASGASASSQRWIVALSMDNASPSTGTVAVALISGASTNTIATLTNGTAWSVSTGWISPADSIRLTRANGTTNLPAVALSHYASPVATNITARGGDQWQICGARPASALQPAATTNTVTLAASYYGGATETLATFTNGAAAYLPSVSVWLSYFDGVALTATRVTNSPTFRIPRLRWID